MIKQTAIGLALALIAVSVAAQQWQEPAPRKAGQGEGPFARLIVKDATVIPGNGMPGASPTTIVIENGRISRLGAVAPKQGDRVIEARGMYVLPGLIDTHVRLVDAGYETLSPDYGLKLLLAHGVTTMVSMQDFEHIDWALRLQRRSAANEIVAPNVVVWADMYLDGDTPESIRANVRSAHARGVTGIGEGSVYSSDVAVMRAALDEAEKLGMRAHWHMSSSTAAEFNALDAARSGLDGLSHWYCLPETLLEGRRAPTFPAGYDSGDTRQRFAAAGRLWKQTVPPHSAQWNKVIDEFRALDFTFEPTFSVYEAHRDYMGVSRAEWHDRYLHPLLERTFVPGTKSRFSHLYDWTSTDEVAWRENYRLWMAFVNEYKNRGGRVVAGTDPGFMWVNFGFGLIRNLELLQEAGFSTLEAIDAATIRSAEHVRRPDEIGSIEVGKQADLVILDRDPRADLKAFYGTGVLSLQADGSTAREGGVKYTIKGGLIYDAKALLREVEAMVNESRKATTEAGRD